MTNSLIDRLGQAIDELAKSTKDANYIFRTTEEIAKFARTELNMVDRDEVAAIAVQELHMMPEREEDP